MNIQFNGQQLSIDTGQTLEALIRQQGLQGKRIAVEVNEELVSRGEYSDCQLQEGDLVEVVQAIGGG